jgi:hypothetical protein
MASKPMHAFLDVRLANCRIQGTSVQESGIRVSTQPTAGEIIVFFHTDTDEGRECLEMRIEGESSEKICDYLIYYTREGRHSEIVCFLELKGTDLAKAVKQVEMTQTQTKTLMQEEIRSKYHQNFTFRICICLRSQAPSTSQRIRDSLIQKFGGRNVEIRHGVKRHDIGPLLRRDTG